MAYRSVSSAVSFFFSSFFFFLFCNILSLRAVREPWPSGGVQTFLPPPAWLGIWNGVGQLGGDALLQLNHRLDPLLHLRLRGR